MEEPIRHSKNRFLPAPLPLRVIWVIMVYHLVTLLSYDRGVSFYRGFLEGNLVDLSGKPLKGLCRKGVLRAINQSKPSRNHFKNA